MNIPGAKTTSWFRGSIIATVITGAFTAFYYFITPALLRLFAGFYLNRNDPDAVLREQLLQVRLHNYFYLGVAACFSLAAWTLGVRLSSALNRIGGHLWRLTNRTIKLLLFGLGLSLVIALAIRFSDREWVHLGCPCWDNYCLFTNLVFQWLSARTRESFDVLLLFMRSYDHSSSVMGPFLFSIVRMATGWNTLTAFCMTNFMATVGTVLILWLCLIKPFRIGPFLEGALLLLFGTNLVVVRCCFVPQTDALVLFWTTALLAVALKRTAQRKLLYDILAVLLLTSGLFVKLSFLPGLALIPLWRMIDGWLKGTFVSREGLKHWTVLFAKELFLFSFIPISFFVAFQCLLGKWGLFFYELQAMKMADSFFPFKVMSLLHTALFFLVLIVWGRSRLQPSDLFLLSGAALFLLSLWATNASGWDRFYLPLIPPLCAVAGRGLIVVQEKGGFSLVGLFVFLAAFLNYALLELWLFY